MTRSSSEELSQRVLSFVRNRAVDVIRMGNIDAPRALEILQKKKISLEEADESLMDNIILFSDNFLSSKIPHIYNIGLVLVEGVRLNSDDLNAELIVVARSTAEIYNSIVNPFYLSQETYRKLNGLIAKAEEAIDRHQYRKLSTP